MARCRRLARLSIGASAVVCLGFALEQGAPFIPGDVIVKFRSGTPGAETAARAAASGADAVLASTVRSLSHDLGVPLLFKRLGGGGDLLLAVDRAGLEDRLLASLREVRNVARVEPAREGADPEAPRRGLRVRFAQGSAEAEEVARAAARAGGAEPIGPLEATHRLESHAGCPLVGRIDSSGELVVEPDLAALSRQLVEGLTSRPDVEYAQLNYVAQIRQ